MGPLTCCPDSSCWLRSGGCTCLCHQDVIERGKKLAEEQRARGEDEADVYELDGEVRETMERI